jgi:hypothetical protein
LLNADISHTATEQVLVNFNYQKNKIINKITFSVLAALQYQLYAFATLKNAIDIFELILLVETIRIKFTFDSRAAFPLNVPFFPLFVFSLPTIKTIICTSQITITFSIAKTHLLFLEELYLAFAVFSNHNCMDLPII